MGQGLSHRARLWQPCPFLPAGLKLPTSSADTRFGDGDGPEVEQDVEERCCPCRPADGQLRMEGEAESFQKKFENFLHNSIIIPRCCPGGGVVPVLGGVPQAGCMGLPWVGGLVAAPGRSFNQFPAVSGHLGR